MRSTVNLSLDRSPRTEFHKKKTMSISLLGEKWLYSTAQYRGNIQDRKSINALHKFSVPEKKELSITE